MFKNALVLSTVLFGTFAFGDDMATIAEGWGATIKAIQVLLILGASLVGLGMMASGGIQLKKHGENPQQVPLNKGLIFLAAGSLLFGLSATSQTMQDTVFGNGGGVDTSSITTDFE